MAIHASFTISVIGRKYQIQSYIFDFISVSNSAMNDTPLFEIQEYQGISIQLDCHVSCFLKIEGLDGLIKRFDETISQGIICSSEEPGYVPGRYFIEFSENERSLRTYFVVEPSAMDILAYKKMVESLKSIQSDLIHDVSRTRGMDFTQILDYELMDYRSLVKFLQMNRDKLRQTLIQVTLNPINKLVKEHYVKQGLDIQGRKAERWQETKGERLKQANPDSEFSLANRIRLDFEIDENYYLKNKLMLFQRKLENLISNFYRRLIALDAQRLGLKENIKRYRIEKSMTEVEYEIRSIDKECDRISEDLERLESRYDSLVSVVDFIKKELRFVNEIMELEWLSQLKSKQEKIVLSHRLTQQYQKLIQLIDIVIGKSKSLNQKQVVNAYRETPHLFELYTFFLVHRLLIDNGYIIEENEYYQNDMGFIDLPSESTMTYTKGLSKIELRYDRQVGRYDYKRGNNFYNLNAHHNRPDILIAYYREDLLIDSLIVEVKCVKQHYLFKDFESTKLTEQFKDYLSFAYAYKNGMDYKLSRSVVRKVLVVYPELEENLLFRDFDDIVYVGLNLEKEVVETKLYDLIKTELIGGDNYENI